MEIVKAAIKLGDKIYTGFDHGDCFKQIPEKEHGQTIEQGFINSNNEFVDRKQAMIIAHNANQIAYDDGDRKTLISEDLHLYWLNQQSKRIKELEEENKKAKISNYLEDYFCVEKENQQLKQQLAESEKENKALKDIRTLERVIPKNTQLNKLSNRDCYLKGFDNAISETIRVFEESYGKDKTELIEERNEYLSDIVKVGGYRHQIKELKKQLHDLPKKIVEEIKAYLNNHTGRCDEYDCTWFDGNIDTDLNTILKKYGGENE